MNIFANILMYICVCLCLSVYVCLCLCLCLSVVALVSLRPCAPLRLVRASARVCARASVWTRVSMFSFDLLSERGSGNAQNLSVIASEITSRNSEICFCNGN